MWQEVLDLATYVHAAFATSVDVLCKGRLDLLEKVKADEQEIDRWEVRIEAECVRVLARYGLAAGDLRRVVAAFRVNRDLEGLADLAENLAKRARKLSREPIAAPFLERIGTLAERVLAILDESLLALRTLDSSIARQAIQSSAGIDRLRNEILGELKQAIRGNPELVNTWLRLINSARNLERATDHAISIVTSVIYVKEAIFLHHEDSGD